MVENCVTNSSRCNCDNCNDSSTLKHNSKCNDLIESNIDIEEERNILNSLLGCWARVRSENGSDCVADGYNFKVIDDAYIEINTFKVNIGTDYLPKYLYNSISKISKNRFDIQLFKLYAVAYLNGKIMQDESGLGNVWPPYTANLVIDTSKLND